MTFNNHLMCNIIENLYTSFILLLTPLLSIHLGYLRNLTWELSYKETINKFNLTPIKEFYFCFNFIYLFINTIHLKNFNLNEKLTSVDLLFDCVKMFYVLCFAHKIYDFNKDKLIFWFYFCWLEIWIRLKVCTLIFRS